MSKYKELYPQTLSDGVGLISTLSSLNVPWAAMNIPSIERMYGVRSGFKTIVDSFAEIPAELRASVLYSMFNEKWTKLWNIYQLEYNPLTAYKVLETGSNEENEQSSKDVTGTDKFTETSSNEIVGSDKVSETSSNEDLTDETVNGIDENYNSVWGFNSSNPVSSDYGNAKDTESTRNENFTASVTDRRSENKEDKSTQVDRSTENTEGTTTERGMSSSHTITKEGNIGYSTPQKLLREEFELWAVPFFQKVFDDIDSFITIMVY